MSRICGRREARSASAVRGVFLVGVDVDGLESELSASSAITPRVKCSLLGSITMDWSSPPMGADGPGTCEVTGLGRPCVSNAF